MIRNETEIPVVFSKERKEKLQLKKKKKPPKYSEVNVVMARHFVYTRQGHVIHKGKTQGYK